MSTRHNSRTTAGRRAAAAGRYTPYSLYRRALRLEPLEDRRLLAVVTVNTLSDTTDLSDNLTTLREAIFATNLVAGADTIDFAPSLTAPGGPVTLSLTQGQLAITDDLTIDGPGWNRLIINAQQQSRIFDIPNTGVEVTIDGLALTGGRTTGNNPFDDTRQFSGGAIRSLSNETLTLTDVKLGGNSTTGVFALGGAIYSLGPVTLNESIVSQNSANGAGSGIYATALVTFNGSSVSGNTSTVSIRAGASAITVNGNDVVLNDSIVSYNAGHAIVARAVTANRSEILANAGEGISTAQGSVILVDSNVADNGGAGIFSRANSLGVISLLRSTMSGNKFGAITSLVADVILTDSSVTDHVTSTLTFAGIFSQGDVTLNNSTVANNTANHADSRGAAIFAVGDVTLNQSTVSGNTSGGNGGGVYSLRNITVRYSTLTDNSAAKYGGAIFKRLSGFTIDIVSSIVAGNTAGLDGPDIEPGDTALEVHYSVIGNNDGTSLAEAPVGAPDANGNLTGGPTHGIIDPLLGPLTDNGGPTMTHALLAGSPAINAGDLNAIAGVDGVPEFDQRGTPFGRVFHGRIDIGAFEYQQASDLNLLVDTLVDENDGNYGRGDLSLREAIALANMWPSVDTIRFDAALSTSGPATIVLTQGELKITSSMTIVGLGADVLTVDASGNDATPAVKDGKGSRVFNVDDGAATASIVIISGLTLTGGDITTDGGAVFSRETLALVDTVVDRNYSTAGAGGGIAAVLRDGAVLVAVRSQIINNQSSTRGAGMSLDVGTGSAVLISGTQVVGNSKRFPFGVSPTSFAGGGIYIVNAGGTATIDSSIVSDNISDGNGGGISFNGPLTVKQSKITNNSVLGVGGGIHFRASTGGGLSIFDSAVTNNEAGSGGGIGLSGSNSSTSTIARTHVESNSAERIGANFGLGGGIYFEQGSLRITDSTIRDNSADVDGGGIHTVSTGIFPPSFLMEGSTVAFNSAATNGGGMSLGRGGTIRDSTVTGNSARTGGAIYARGATVMPTNIEHSTITQNEASTTTGGVYVSAGPLNLNHSIVALNTSPGPADDFGLGRSVQVTAAWSLIGDGNGSGLAEAPVGAADVNGNLIGGAVHGLIDPLLRPLADYGGPTHTLALAPRSPAIDAGDPSAVAGAGGVPVYDQRGVPFDRVIGGRIDMGAFEFHNPRGLILVVDTLVDESDGNYSIGDLSLREAIQLANLAPDENTIHFDPALTAGGPATIQLSLGELGIVGGVFIVGHGADLLTIDASGSDPTPTVNDGLGSSIFEIGDGTDELFDVSISGLTLTGGDSQYGGAIVSTENLTITGSTITGNHAAQLGGGVAVLYGSVEITDCIISNNTTDGTGGGIAASGAELVVEECAIDGNVAAVGGGIHAFDTLLSVSDSSIDNNEAIGGGGAGGGIYHKVGTLTVADSTISGNTSISGGGVYSDGEAEIVRSTLDGNYSYLHGGGIYSFGKLVVRETTISGSGTGLDGAGIHAAGDVLIDSSTLADNDAGRHGGAIWVEVVDGALSIINSTISGNNADNEGGGVWITGTEATATIAHSTIVENSAHHLFGFGGGVVLNSGSLQLDHTIVATNAAKTGPDAFMQANTNVSAQYSLIGNAQDTNLTEAPVGLPDANGNFIGGPVHGVIDPLLGSLADNGGPTLTHALLAGSPAINEGDLAAVAGVNGVPQFDQRGTPFGRVFHGRIDIGAFEYQQASDLNLLVDTLVDENDGDYGRGDLSLREAILLSNKYGGSRSQPDVMDTIRFDTALTAGGPATILLTLGELQIFSLVTILGPGADLFTVDASGNDPTPDVHDGKGSRVVLISGQSVLEPISVSIAGLTLTGADRPQDGGGISSRLADLTLEDMFVFDNAAARGGGIWFATGNLRLVDTIVASNTATQNGGGVHVAMNASLTVEDSTITGNTAQLGGGVYFRDFDSSGTHQLTVIGSRISVNHSRANGGGVWARGIGGAMTIHDSVISGNTAGQPQLSGGGAGIYADLTNVAMSITSSSLAENMATRSGGAASLRLAGGTLVVDNSQILLNRITGGESQGGGLHIAGQNATATIRNSLIEGNATVGNFAAGGGISSNGIPLVVEASTITGNTAARAGGGIYSGALQIRDSEISGNSAQFGGGINHRSQSLIIDRTTISGNMASRSGGGGYIGSRSSPVTITNSTIDNNAAAEMGGGLMVTPFNATIVNSTFSGNSAGQNGGAIWNGTATTNVRHSTITDNTAARGGGLGGGTFHLNHAIVAGNDATSGPGDDIAAATVTARYSLIGTNAGTTLAEAPVGLPDANGNLIGGPIHGTIDPLLGPLADNGGPTFTHALLAGSPAINAGDPVAVAGVGGVPVSDQRGFPFSRVFGGRIDIGAFELQSNPLPGDFNLNGIVDTSDYNLWRNTVGSTNDFRADGTGDGVVDNADYALWRANFGQVRQPQFASTSTLVQSAAVAVGAPPINSVLRTAKRDVQPNLAVAAEVQQAVVGAPAARPRVRAVQKVEVVEQASVGLLAWLSEGEAAERAVRQLARGRVVEDAGAETHTERDGAAGVLDEAFAMLLSDDSNSL